MQLEAPPERRGRFVGAAGMTGQGFQAGSGILIGVLAGGLGVAGGVVGRRDGAAAVTVALLIVVAGAAASGHRARRSRPVELEA